MSDITCDVSRFAWSAKLRVIFWLSPSHVMGAMVTGDATRPLILRH